MPDLTPDELAAIRERAKNEPPYEDAIEGQTAISIYADEWNQLGADRRRLLDHIASQASALTRAEEEREKLAEVVAAATEADGAFRDNETDVLTGRMVRAWSALHAALDRLAALTSESEGETR